MKVRVLNEGQNLWQGVSSWFRPHSDPWAQFVKDEDVGALMSMVTVLNMRPGVTKLSLDNPFLLDTFPEGFPLVIPDDDTLTTFPAAVTYDEWRTSLGIPGSDDTRAPDYNYDSSVQEWVNTRILELENQRALHGTIVAKNMQFRVRRGLFL